MEIGLFFCTLRQPSGRRTPADFFGSERARAPSTGVLRVSLPDFDAVASNSQRLPFDWSYSRTRVTGNTSKKLEVSACIVLDVQPLLCNTPRGREATVFVPGFNSSFDWAARKLALYAYKLRRDAPVFLFSWPSFEVRCAQRTLTVSTALRCRGRHSSFPGRPLGSFLPGRIS